MKKKIYPILGIIIIILAFYVVLTRRTAENGLTPFSDQKEEITPAEILNPEIKEEPALEEILNLEESTVFITNSGFVPEKLEILSGVTVKFINQTNQKAWVASGPHPIHIDLPGFDNVGGINPGEIYEFTFNKTGNWKYHDHLNPNLGGTIIVK